MWEYESDDLGEKQEGNHQILWRESESRERTWLKITVSYHRSSFKNFSMKHGLECNCVLGRVLKKWSCIK